MVSTGKMIPVSQDRGRPRARSGLEAFDDASRREELKYGRPPREVGLSGWAFVGGAVGFINRYHLVQRLWWYHPLSWDKPPFSITTDQLITGTAPPTKGRKRLRRPAKVCSASCEFFPQPAGFGSKSTAIPTTRGMLQHGAGGPMNQMWSSKWFQPWDHFIHSGWITTTKPCCHWGNYP